MDRIVNLSELGESFLLEFYSRMAAVLAYCSARRSEFSSFVMKNSLGGKCISPLVMTPGSLFRILALSFISFSFFVETGPTNLKDA